MKKIKLSEYSFILFEDGSCYINDILLYNIDLSSKKRLMFAAFLQKVSEGLGYQKPTQSKKKKVNGVIE